MTNTFLPQGYEEPQTLSNFLKIEPESTVRVRILTSAVVGWQYFNNDNKFVKSKTPFVALPSDIGYAQDGTLNSIQHFWAFVVWNYDIQTVQVYQVTQKTIREAISGLIKDEDWGNPLEYDIKITRSGSGKEKTTYSINPAPKSPLDSKIAKIYNDNPINLESIFENDSKKK